MDMVVELGNTAAGHLRSQCVVAKVSGDLGSFEEYKKGWFRRQFVLYNLSDEFESFVDSFLARVSPGVSGYGGNGISGYG